MGTPRLHRNRAGRSASVAVRATYHNKLRRNEMRKVNGSASKKLKPAKARPKRPRARKPAPTTPLGSTGGPRFLRRMVLKEN